MKHLVCAAIVFAIAGAGVAHASTDSNDCLRQRNILSFHALNDRSVVVEVVGHHKFKVDTIGVCPNLTWKDAIAFHTLEGSQLACVARGDTLVSREFGGSSGIGKRCTVASVEPYPPAKERAGTVKSSSR